MRELADVSAICFSRVLRGNPRRLSYHLSARGGSDFAILDKPKRKYPEARADLSQAFPITSFTSEVSGYRCKA
jgi:hypothetical protein